MKLSEVYHLYRRAGFGILPKEARRMTKLPREEVVDQLFSNSRNPGRIDIGLGEFEAIFDRTGEIKLKKFRNLVKKTRERHLELSAAWMNRMIYSEQSLNERMTLFWANIFVSREPAMMKYLNTNQNKRNHPNENFARELMELFTLGEGQYTETDIKEAARAFTGYNFKLDGSFRFVLRKHDFGEKEFMGWKGNFQGDDIINIICNERGCARYICERMYRYFVNDKLNKAHVESMTDVFYRNYDIAEVMHFMLTSEWFYDSINIGSKIKSPIDLLVSINNVVPYRFEENKHLIFVQRLLGQSLLQPPNVSGWGEGRDWISSNTLMLRLKLPAVFVGEGVIPSSNLAYQFGRRYFGDQLKVKENWKAFEENYGVLDREELAIAVCASELTEGSKKLLTRYENYSIKEYAIQLMSLPEFQLS